MPDAGVIETAAVTAVSLAATAASTGISYYSQQQQARNAESIANYNAAVQRQNADIQARVAQQQATWQQQASMAQYQAQQNNAATLRNQAVAEEAQGREQVDRLRTQQAQLLAAQRARIAKSGLVNEGSPLAVLADTAKTTELGIQDSAYQTDLASRQDRQKAADEEFQSGFSLMDASLDAYKASSADVSRQIAYREADLTKLQGQAAAQGDRMQAGASLLSGVAGFAKSAGEDYNQIGAAIKNIPVSKPKSTGTTY